MKKILVIADQPNWVFDKIYHGIKNNCKKYFVDVWYQFSKLTQKNNHHSHKDFDVILYLCDFAPDNLKALGIPRDKVILAIRSEVQLPIYENSDRLESLVAALAVSNEKLFERFYPKHSMVELIPGGVDVDLFSFKKKDPFSPLVVGWAGSISNHGKEIRNLDLVERACEIVGYEFNPAIKENGYRTQSQMVYYYQNDIDIYIDLSLSAGRQNGMLEAGACGRPVISSRAGVAESLITHGKNGYLANNQKDVCELLISIQSHLEDFGSNLREEIENNWSWKTHAKKFELLFDKVCK